MRLSGVSTPTTSFAIPPGAPPAVEQAWLELNRVGALLEDTKSDLRDAKQALTQAQALDTKAAVAAATAGEVLADPNEHERKAQEIADRLQALLPGYRQATDEASVPTGAERVKMRRAGRRTPGSAVASVTDSVLVTYS